VKIALNRLFQYLASNVTWAGFKTLIKTLGSNLVTWFLILFRKKALLALSILTTLQGTIHQAYVTFNQGGNFSQLGSVALGELHSNFLGAAPHIAKGLSQLLTYFNNPWDIMLLLNSVWEIWTGVSSVYIFLFLYTAIFVGRIQEDRASWREKYMFLGLWLALSLFLHPEKTVAIFENLSSIGDLASSAVWEASPANETVNQSVNQSLNQSVNQTG